MSVLHDFNLLEDVLSRLLTSIETVTARVLDPDSVERRFEFLEIAVLGPAGQIPKGHTWGFFLVERASTAAQIESTKGYYVEYYLYLDKKRGE